MIEPLFTVVFQTNIRMSVLKIFPGMFFFIPCNALELDRNASGFWKSGKNSI